ncbi:alanine racemase [Dongshaea marina]|uniref:alanine racemase n=1 Tax=Dongshaea marina TaxID=2047966 RepID=UPI000D3E0C71|nr:alanine racemase [Dongshaea marina]
MQTATAEINLAALRHNFSVVRDHAPHSKIIAVVKANAYGHGLLEVAKALPQADAYAVARIEEALTLRCGGIVKPIILLEGFFHASDLPILATNNLQTVVHSPEQLEALEQATLPQPIVAWLKLDSGMHRLGVTPDDFASFCHRMQACPNIAQPFNLMTHFGCADECENQMTERQLSLFKELTSQLKGKQSLANSAGILAWPASHQDYVRPGIMLYGVSPFPEHTAQTHGLRPVMSLKTRVIAIRAIKKGESVGYGATWTASRDGYIAVLAVGYGDGYPRMAPNGTPVIIGNQRYSLAGRPSMDMLTVDLGAEHDVSVGDIATLWGEGLPVEEIALHIGTIPYELVTKLTSRVQMRYIY